MVRDYPRLRGFSTPQPSRSRYPEEVRRLCLTNSWRRRPYDTPDLHNRCCPQCGLCGTFMERIAFREGRAGEWYRVCKTPGCRNVYCPPQPGMPPDLVTAIENARQASIGQSSRRSLTSATRHIASRPYNSAPPSASRFEGFVRSMFPNLGEDDEPASAGPSTRRTTAGSSAAPPCSSTPARRFNTSKPGASISPPSVSHGNLDSVATGTSPEQVVHDEALAHALQAFFDEEGALIKKRRRDVEKSPPQTPNVIPLKRQRNFQELAREFLALTREMGLLGEVDPSLNADAPINSPVQIQVAQQPGCDRESSASVEDTPTPATRKRVLKPYVPPQVPSSSLMPLKSSRSTTTTCIPAAPEVIEISSDSSDEDDGMSTASDPESRLSSVISLTDSEDDAPPRRPFIRSIARTPSDVIDISDSEPEDCETRPQGIISDVENTDVSGIDVSRLTRTHPGLVASRSATCLTDLIASSISSEATDLFAEGTNDGDPYIPRHLSPRSEVRAVELAGRAACLQDKSRSEDEFVPFGDPYRFEIYPSLANLADGPLPVFNQAAQWMLTVRIWYDDDAPPATKMITLDQRSCEIVLARYHIVRRIFNYRQVYEFRVWDPSMTDWRAHALTMALEVSTDPGQHTLLVRLPSVDWLAAWSENVGHAYGLCTTVERPLRKGKEREST